jgi:hypothetical protein
LIELKDDELGFQLQLGDRDNWNYALDADTSFMSFCLQYERNGKVVFWQKFDH